jgi:hypothetical protein
MMPQQGTAEEAAPDRAGRPISTAIHIGTDANRSQKSKSIMPHTEQGEEHGTTEHKMSRTESR